MHTTQEENQKVHEAWRKEIEDTQEVRNHNLKMLHEQKLLVIEEMRRLFRIVIELSVGIIIAPHIFDLLKNRTYYFIGVSFLSFVVIFIVLAFREALGRDFVGLQKSEDEMVVVLDNKISIVKKYLQAGIFNYEKDKEQYQEIINSAETRKLVDRADKLKLDRENRDNLPKDYSGELVMFLFISGIFWVLLGIFPEYMSWPVVILAELVIIIVTSTDSMWLIAKSFSATQNFLRRNTK